MDLQEITKKFGTEEQCRDYIYSIRWKDGYRCPRCGSTEAWKTGEMKYKCQKCGHKASVTAGTVFGDSHIPLPTWFKAIWYVSADPTGITADKLQKEFSLGSNRTALSMLHKIKQAMIRTTLDKLSGTVEIVTTDLRVIDKKVFVAFAVEVRNRKVGKIRIKRIKRDSPLELVEFIDRCIEPNSTIIHKELMLRDVMLYEDYTEAHKPYTYSFSCTRKVKTKLENWLFDNYTEGKLSRCLNEFCARVNSMKCEYDFCDLLNNAIRLKPSSDKTMKFGIDV